MRLGGRLSALAVKHAAARGIYCDGNGLVLQVARGGSKSWLLRYRLGGRRRHLGLGGYPAVPLAEARERAEAARVLLQQGKDPVAERRGRRITAMLSAAKATTFQDCGKGYIDSHRHGWRPRNTHEWIHSLSTHAYPILGLVPVQEVNTDLVMKVLQPLWTTKTETAAKLRGRIEAILDWAKVRGLRVGENSARWDGYLENLLPAKSRVVTVVPHAAMAHSELPTLMTALRARSDITSRALEFAILTAARTGEVLGGTWDEVNLQTRRWIIPAHRMKMKREHRVALPDSAVKLLAALPGEHVGYIFAGFKTGRPLAKMALTKALQRAGCSDVTVHGMRAAFSTWAAERTTFPAEVVELALAHVCGSKVARAYRRTDRIEDRARLMEQWSQFLAGEAQPTAEVVELRRSA
jgi:integrase